MFSLQQKAQCVLWYENLKSPVKVRRLFRRSYDVQYKECPCETTIVNWYKKFKETGSCTDRTRSGRGKVPEVNVVKVREAFDLNPSLSIRKASVALKMCNSTVRKLVRVQLKRFPYKARVLHHLKREDFSKRFDMCSTLLEHLEQDPKFLKRIGFSDECTMWLSGNVNKQNVRAWSTARPNFNFDFERDSPKVTVWCAVLIDRIVGPYFFQEPTVQWKNYLDMLEQYAIPQLMQAEEEWGYEVLFQQDGAPPHWAREVRRCLDNIFPNRWIGRDGPISWAPRSPDLTPPDYFLWGYIKNKIYQTPVTTIAELKQRIRDAIASVTPAMLRAVWRELESRLDQCRGTNGAHVENH
jgi:Helix-turn-helix domain (DUF4817)